MNETLKDFIGNEVKKYRAQVRRQKLSKSNINLDSLEQCMRKCLRNCTDKIANVIGYENYEKYCYFVSLAENKLQEVDEKEFGVFVNGKMVGYNYTGGGRQ